MLRWSLDNDHFYPVQRERERERSERKKYKIMICIATVYIYTVLMQKNFEEFWG